MLLWERCDDDEMSREGMLCVAVAVAVECWVGATLLLATTTSVHFLCVFNMVQMLFQLFVDCPRTTTVKRFMRWGDWSERFLVGRDNEGDWNIIPSTQYLTYSRVKKVVSSARIVKKIKWARAIITAERGFTESITMRDELTKRWLWWRVEGREIEKKWTNVERWGGWLEEEKLAREGTRSCR